MAVSRITSKRTADNSSNCPCGSAKSKRRSHAKTKAAVIATDCITNMIQFRHRSSMLLPSPFCGNKAAGSGRHALSASNLQKHLLNDLAGMIDVGFGECRMDQEHQAGFAQFTSRRVPDARTPLIRECVFQINLTAAPTAARYTASHNHLTDAVLIPSPRQCFLTDVDVVLVIGVAHVFRHHRNTQPANLREMFR